MRRTKAWMDLALAVAGALDVPMGATPADDLIRNEILLRRVQDVRFTLDHVFAEDGMAPNPAWHARWLRSQTRQTPLAGRYRQFGQPVVTDDDTTGSDK